MLALWNIAALLSLALAKEENSLKNEFGHRQICGGVYGPNDAHGPFTPAVNVSFPTKGGTTGELAVIVYEYGDIDSIGYPAHSGDLMYWKYMCDQESVYANECSDLGKFIVSGSPAKEILSKVVKIEQGQAAESLQYLVKDTGYYCVAAQATPGHESMQFNVEVGFQNAYGHLPGTDYPLILFHFVQSMIYCAVFLVWVVPLIVYRKSVLPVQLHITVLCLLMMAEQFVVSSYYYVANVKGHSALTTFFLVLSSVWSSLRLAYTFFMLLIVARGYSVVHPSLGKKMRESQLLSALLFVTSLIYSVEDYSVSENSNTGSWMPLITNIIFLCFIVQLAFLYFYILAAMRETLEYLNSRKQMAKVKMYRFVGFVLAGSLIAIALQLVVVILQFFFVPMKTVVVNYWRSQWVIFDGWPNIVYCIAFILIMILWRPNRDNMRYAMSTQLSQNEDDADEFEIGSLNGSDDDLEIPAGEDYDGGAQYNSDSHAHNNHHNRRTGNHPDFDAEANHGLSDLEEGDAFEVNAEDRNLPGDEDTLVQAPSQRLNKKKSR